jgi:hypothetical protein
MSQRRTASTPSTADGMVVPLEGVFVAIDLDDDTAYVAYEGGTGIRWEEVSRTQGELLARLGAHAQIHIGTPSLIGRSSTVRFARRSA